MTAGIVATVLCAVSEVKNDPLGTSGTLMYLLNNRKRDERLVTLFKAESDAQIFEHFAPWRAQFGIEMDFTPVIGCQDVVNYHKKLFAKMS